jgi:dienelactone hydrolase
MAAKLFEHLVDTLQPWATGLLPNPPAKPPYPEEIYTYTTRAWGSHQAGNYIMAYLPVRETPAVPTVIVYLHGFAFGNPYFYDAHMQHLAKQGYYVFFADYQIDNFPDTQSPQPPSSDVQTAKQFLEAALDSFQTAGSTMIANANEAFQQALQVVLPQCQELDIYLFGHSVGGLFVLSWPFFIGPANIKGIVAADPIPGTANLPTWLKVALRSDAPFLTQPVLPAQTCKGLSNIPTAILIGDSDLFVKVSDWQKLWPDLATDCKRIYISQSDYYYNIYRCDDRRALIAYHNQSVTNTLFYGPEDVQLLIGGAGIQNDLRWRYVWSAFDAVIRGDKADALSFAMGEWSNGKPVKRVKRWPRA